MLCVYWICGLVFLFCTNKLTHPIDWNGCFTRDKENEIWCNAHYISHPGGAIDNDAFPFHCRSRFFFYQHHLRLPLSNHEMIREFFVSLFPSAKNKTNLHFEVNNIRLIYRFTQLDSMQFVCLKIHQIVCLCTHFVHALNACHVYHSHFLFLQSCILFARSFH